MRGREAGANSSCSIPRQLQVRNCRVRVALRTRRRTRRYGSARASPPPPAPEDSPASLCLSFLSFSLSFFFLSLPLFLAPFLVRRIPSIRNIVIVVQYGKWRTWKNRLIQRANRSVARANRRRKGVSDVARGTGPLTFATTLLSCEGRRRCARIVG